MTSFVIILGFKAKPFIPQFQKAGIEKYEFPKFSLEICKEGKRREKKSGKRYKECPFIYCYMNLPAM